MFAESPLTGVSDHHDIELRNIRCCDPLPHGSFPPQHNPPQRDRNSLCRLAEIDAPVVAEQHAREAFVVERALAAHADLASYRIRSDITDRWKRINKANLRIGSGLL